MNRPWQPPPVRSVHARPPSGEIPAVIPTNQARKAAGDVDLPSHPSQLNAAARPTTRALAWPGADGHRPARTHPVCSYVREKRPPARSQSPRLRTQARYSIGQAAGTTGRQAHARLKAPLPSIGLPGFCVASRALEPRARVRTDPAAAGWPRLHLPHRGARAIAR